MDSLILCVSKYFYSCGTTMGQTPSSPLGSRGNTRLSLRSPFIRRSKVSTTNLSHTFNMPSLDNNAELMNINIASEEQLMTLPGITRQISQSIVEHRQAIGRFRKVDDLALVSGIGAEKLNLLRGEICTSRRMPSRCSSSTQSLDSLRSSLDSFRPQININTVTIFQLQCIPGLNQELAANVIHYREKKGLFKSLDDLVKVKGMDTMRVNSIKHYLSVEDDIKHEDNNKSVVTSNGNIKNMNGCIKLNVTNGISKVNNSAPRTPGYRKTLSVPIKCCTSHANGFSTAPVNDIYELLSAYSYRPVVEEEFIYNRDGKKAIRIGTWNLHQLNLEKANNPGFREVVCCTILENRVSLLCLQELLDEEALKVLVNELNLPTLRRIQEKKCNNRCWKYCIVPSYVSKKYFGFLYDADCENINVELKSFKEYSCSINENGCWSQIEETMDRLSNQTAPSTNIVFVSFKIHHLDLLVVNVLLDSNSDKEVINILDDIWKIVNSSNQNAVLLGDFYNMKNVDDIHKSHHIVNEESETTLETNSELQGRSDILVSDYMHSRFTGHHGTIKYGLNHMAIPNGWSWGGPASPYCPVWAEFFVE